MNPNVAVALSARLCRSKCDELGTRRSKTYSWLVTAFAAVFCLLIVSIAQSRCVAQDSALSSKVNSVAPEACLSWFQWANPHKADADSTNAVDRMMAEPDVNKFSKDLIDKLGELPAVLVPREAPPVIKKIAKTLGPQVVDVILRKQGCFFVEQFEIDENQEPKNLKFGMVVEVGDNVDQTMKSLQDLLDLASAPMEKVELDGLSVVKVAVPPDGPFSELGIARRDGYLLAASSLEMLEEMNGRITAGKVPGWLSELQSKQKHIERISVVGQIDLADLKTALLPLADPQVLRSIKALGLDNLKSLEFSSGYGKIDFVQRYSLKFDGSPTGIFDALGDEGITSADLAHFPEDSMIAVASSLDGNKALRQFERILIQLDPNTAQQVATGMIRFQGETGIDLRGFIENLGPTFTLHNGLSDGILSGAIFEASVQDSAAVERTLKDAFKIFQGSNFDFDLSVEESTLSGTPIKTLRFGGVPVPVEPSYYFEGDKMILSFFPSALNSTINSDSVPSLVKAKLFEPYLPLLKPQSTDTRVVGFSYSETKLSFEIMYGYASALSAMGKNMIGGSLDYIDLPLTSEQHAGVKNLLGDLQLPSCRSIVKHLTPQVAVVRKEKDAIVLESHSSMTSSNLTMVAPGVAIGMLLPAVQQVRAAARRVTSANNIRQMGLAAHNYESVHRRFPSGDGPVEEGGPAVSWRVKILPFIEEQALYDQYNFDEPWDSENNREILASMPETFRNPSSAAQAGHTVYRGVGGEGGIMGVDGGGKSVGRGFRDITDGTSNTILFLECPDGMSVPWTKPDGGIDPEKITPWQMAGNHPGGFNACLCDGSTHFISLPLAEEIFQNLLNMRDGNIVNGF